MNTNEEELLGAVADSLKNTETGDKWTLLSPAERREFKEIVLQVVATLPERQQSLSYPSRPRVAVADLAMVFFYP